MSKKKLLLSIEDLKALGIIKKRKKKRKVKKNKRASDYNNIYGIKSDSSHLKTGFGGQINTNNDLQNELIRNQMKIMQDDQNMKKQTQLMAIEDRRFNRNEYYPRIDELNRRYDQLVNQSSKIVRDIYNKINDDNIDVARTGGSEFFNTEGIPLPENDNINENIAEYVSQKAFVPEPLSLKQKRQENLSKARQVRAQKVLIRKQAKAKATEKEAEKIETENENETIALDTNFL
jgi:hypothetical protein